tara:strand:- start:1 stop:438 length:438 start_codon:yes stop_codon:yes gene_type:complete
MNFKSGEYGNIHIMEKEGAVYIVNPQKLKINKLVYATNSCTLYEDDKLKRIISSTPIYEIKNIPAESYFKIEDIDPFEDGLGDGTNISYYAEEIHWGNGDVEKGSWSLGVKTSRKKTFFNEGDELNLTEVLLKKKKIGEEAGYVK